MPDLKASIFIVQSKTTHLSFRQAVQYITQLTTRQTQDYNSTFSYIVMGTPLSAATKRHITNYPLIEVEGVSHKLKLHGYHVTHSDSRSGMCGH